jgi:predicted kinase
MLTQFLIVLLALSAGISNLSAVQADPRFIQQVHELLRDEKMSPVLYVPIGPSGSGKSTLYKKLQTVLPEISSFSLDSLRHEWYDPNDYDAAWKSSAADPAFYPRAQALFCEQLASLQDIYFDATNLNPSKRDFYVQRAKASGYFVVGIVFSVNVDILIARQATRGDKSIAEDVVRSQYASLVPPQIGEGIDLVFHLDDS